MNRKQTIIAYLENTLDEGEKIAFEKELMDSPTLQTAVENWQQLLQVLESQPLPQTDLEMDFEKLMKRYPTTKQKTALISVTLHRNWLAAALIAGIVLITGGSLLLQQNRFNESQIQLLSTQLQQQQQLLAASILQQVSASDKIKAMNTVSRQQLDQELQKALFFALNYDDNVNVRLKAAQALGSVMDDPAVRQKMIASLAQQDQPEIQILLIDLLASFQEKNAIPVLQQIIQNEQVLEVVKDKAAQGMAILL